MLIFTTFSFRRNRYNNSSTLVLDVNTSACHGTKDYVRYVEHVQVVASMYLQWRGAAEISLTSPSGTKSWILKNRINDVQSGSFDKWHFLSTHFWGEDPRGLWKVEFFCRGKLGGHWIIHFIQKILIVSRFFTFTSLLPFFCHVVRCPHMQKVKS